MKKALRAIILLLVLGLAAIQFVPVDRENPEVTADFDESPAIHAILKRSCYDCHSNETRWPWYARVAPVSWLIAHDVDEGREHLNFSEWGQMSAKDRAKAREEIAEEVEEGKMPLENYLRLHADAEVSREEIEALEAWAARP